MQLPAKYHENRQSGESAAQFAKNMTLFEFW